MLIEDQMVEINLVGAVVKHYEDLGYEIPRKKNKQYLITVPKGTKIKVKATDLPKGSNVKVNCLCDYCLENGKETIVAIPYQKYIEISNSKIKKVCCNECYGKKITDVNMEYTYENMIEIFKSKGLKALIRKEDYKTSSTLVDYECMICGHKSRAKLCDVNFGRGCKICKKKETVQKQHFDYEYVYNYFKEHGCELLSKEYHNKDEVLDYICSCGEYATISFGSFRRGTRCRKCGVKKSAKTRTRTLEEVQKIFEKEGCVLLSTKYDGYKVKLDYICSCGNKDSVSLSHFQQGQRCQECGKKKMKQAIIDAGIIPISTQQIYLQRLFGGILNYQCKGYSLDIAFPESKIYIEYDGAGHDLSVRLGSVTEKEFKNREIKRYKSLKYDGWKLINIISPTDYLPTNEVLINEYNKALEWFKSNNKGHWHYQIDISKYAYDNTYGKLTRILKKDFNYKEVV